MTKQTYFLMIIILFTSNVFAQNMTSGYCGPKDDEQNYGTNCEWSYDDNTKTLKISGTGEMSEFDRNMEDYTTAPWYQYHNEIQNLVVENGINNIGKNAFALLTSLNNVNIADSVTKIDLGGFYYCSSLNNINLPKNLQSIGVIAFTYSGLKSIDIPDSVKNVDTYAFATSSLESITFSDTVQLGSSVFWEMGDAHPQNGFRIYCKGEVKICEEKIRETNQSYPFSMNTKVYRSNRRIYTLNEAIQEAGERNMFKIKYR